jgi:RNA polymerase sigma-70 factor (ECF subfamily)
LSTLKRIPISEDELVRGLQSHDEKAFALLYDNYSPYLLGIIAKIVKDEAEAENLLQDSFVKI